MMLRQKKTASPLWVAIALTFGAATTALYGCGGSNSVAEQANEKYRESVSIAEAGDRQEAIELMSEAIDIRPEPFMYLKRAEFYLRIGDDQAALADIESAKTHGAIEVDCQWLLDESQKPAGKRFQENQASPPSLNK